MASGACPVPSSAVGSVGAAVLVGGAPPVSSTGINTPRYSRSLATTATRTPSGDNASAVTGPLPTNSSDATRSRLGLPVADTRYTSGLVAPFCTTQASSPVRVKLGRLSVAGLQRRVGRSGSAGRAITSCCPPAGSAATAAVTPVADDCAAAETTRAPDPSGPVTG